MIACSCSRARAGSSATTLRRNLTVAERFLTAVGVDDATAHTDAEEWALVMSDDVAEALSDLLDGVSSCPFDDSSSLD